ncbi:MAG: protein kinase, partial [Chloroflexi bacterium]|nr:protein kinase [Chloroflexota bacterium]
MAQRQIDHYHLLEEIAAGGQATVHKAWDTRTGQIVALKVMHPHLAKDASYLERFHREARLAASITHPNVIRIFDVGQSEDAHYMALEYLPLSLHSLIQTQGHFPVDRAVEITLQVAMGLEVAHDQGIVHRDIKPQNILIGFDGEAKVTDFGISRAEEFATMTRTGAIMGTPHYMSPEQAKGLPVDSRTDLYSLGIVLYQMLTGEVPFDADTPWEVIRQQIEGNARPMRRLRGDVPRVVEQVVNRCLEKNPGKRYQSAQEMIQSLERALPDGAYRPRQQAAAAPQVVSNVVAPPVQPPAPPPQPREAVAKPRSYRRAWLWGFASAIVVVAGLVVLSGLAKDPQPGAEPTPAVPAAVEREVVREVPVELPVKAIVEREVVKKVPVAVEQEAVAMPVTSILMPATTVTSTTAQ